ncbi:hypothetical protein ABIA40_002513 [Bradyrhizobium sp. USDA 223]
MTPNVISVFENWRRIPEDIRPGYLRDVIDHFAWLARKNNDMHRKAD